MSKLIMCTMCENLISPNARACPKCGEPVFKVDTLKLDEETIIQSEIFNIKLMSAGSKKIKIIGILRSLLNLDLNEAKSLIDNLPSLIIEKVSWDEAKSIVEKFEENGATIGVFEIRSNTNIIEYIHEEFEHDKKKTQNIEPEIQKNKEKSVQKSVCLVCKGRGRRKMKRYIITSILALLFFWTPLLFIFECDLNSTGSYAYVLGVISCIIWGFKKRECKVCSGEGSIIL